MKTKRFFGRRGGGKGPAWIASLERRVFLSSAQLVDLNATPSFGSGLNNPRVASDGFAYAGGVAPSGQPAVFRIDGTPAGAQPVATIAASGRSRSFVRLPAGLVFNHGAQWNNGHAEASDLYVVPNGLSVASALNYVDFAHRPRQLTPIVRAGDYAYYWTRTGLARTNGTPFGTTMVSATLLPPSNLTWFGTWESMDPLIASSGTGAVVTNRTSLWRVTAAGSLSMVVPPSGFGEISGVYSGSGYAFVRSTTGNLASIRDGDGAVESLGSGGVVHPLGTKHIFQRSAGLTITDGTVAGTEPLLDAQGQTIGGASYLVSDGATAAFFIPQVSANAGLWTTDGTAAGTRRITSAITLANGSNGSAGVQEIVPWVRLVAIEGPDLVCLGTVNGVTGFYRVNAASPDAPVLLRSFAANPVGGRAVGLLDAPAFALAQPPAPELGELLLIDPTLSDGFRSLLPATAMQTRGSQPSRFHQVSSGVGFFHANGTAGTAWYRTDGTTAGTVAALGSASIGTVDIVHSVVAEDAVLFIGRTQLQGDGLFRIAADGSIARLAELFPPTMALDSTRLIPVSGGRWAFASGDSLWLTDGTVAGTRRASNFVEVCWYVRNIAEFNGRFYFNAYNASTGTEVYSTNGSDTNLQVLDLVSGSTSSGGGALGVAGGKLILSHFQSGVGVLLKASDGTLAGTAAIGPVFNTLEPVAQAGGFVYFLARTTSSGDLALWQTDGTTAGTRTLGLTSSTVSPLRSAVVADELWGSAEGRAFRMRNSGAAAIEWLSPTGLSLGLATVQGAHVYFASTASTGGIYRADSAVAAPAVELYAARSVVGSTSDGAAVLAGGEIIARGTTDEPAIFRANDALAPAVLSISYDHATSRVCVLFDKQVSGVGVDDLQIAPAGGGASVQAVAARYDALTGEATYTLPRGLPSDRYAIMLPANAVVDAADRPLQAMATLSAALQQGDITGDGAANFDDLLVLASNYNQSIRAYAQGDLTGDERVNFDDLLVLAANYNRSPSGAIALIASPGAPSDDDESDGNDEVAVALVA